LTIADVPGSVYCMVPGGTDIVCAFAGGPSEAISLVEKAVYTVWADAVVRNAGTGERLIYQNEAAEEDWRKHGASDTNADTMIYVLASWGSVTLVVDDTEAPAVKAALAALAVELVGSN